MAEAVVSLVLKQLYLLALEERALLKSLRRGFAEIKSELESIDGFLKDADRRAENSSDYGVKVWVDQVREVSFRIEDVIDEYIIHVARYYHVASVPRSVHKIRTYTSRRRIASEIQNITSSVIGIKSRSERYNFRDSTNSGGAECVNWSDPRRDAHFMEDIEVVGFETPRDELINCLIQGTQQLSVISVVGMGGLGKTTLTKYVFDNDKVKNHFKCRSFVTVSQSYTVKELLIEMVKKLCEDANEPLPGGLVEKDDNLLVTKVKKFIHSKQFKYLVVFDDVWKEEFSDEIRHAFPDNNNGGRLIITTRMMTVAECFNQSFLGYVHELKHLHPHKNSSARRLLNLSRVSSVHKTLRVCQRKLLNNVESCH